MSKKLICFLLSLMLLLCSVSFGVSGAEETGGDELQLLQKLDIVCGADENKLENPISKSAFINYILNITGDYKYSDYYDENALMAAEQTGIISLAADVLKTDNLSAEEAVTIAVRLLGYEAMAQDKGGYPSGYMAVASQLGMLSGVSLGDKMTYKQAVVLLANIIECDYAQFGVGDSGNVIVYEKDMNVLTHFRGIYTVEAVITADEESDLYSDGEIGEDRIKVGDEIYSEGNSNAKSLLGHYTRVYIKNSKSDFDEIIYALDMARDVFVLSYEDIEAVEDNARRIRYYKKEGSTKTAYLNIGADAAYALNGVSHPQCGEGDFLKEGAVITLVENDGNSEYDFVNIESCDTMIVAGISIASMKIHNEYTFDESLRVLDLSLYDKNKIHIYKNGNPIDISGIGKGDVLSVYRTPKGTEGEINIYAEQSGFDGIVESYSEADEDNIKVVVDGEEYKLSKLYISANKSNEKSAMTVKVGNRYSFGLDKNGRIVFVKTVQNDSLVYGYATGMAETPTGISNDIKIRMFTEEGEWKVYTLADRVKWNGNGNAEPDEIYNNGEIASKIPGLIGIKFNSEGEINAIETPVGYVKGMDRERLNTTGEITANYRYNGTTFSNYYYMNSDTRVFIVPDEDTEDESLYEIGTSTSFKSDNSYTVEGYNRDEYYVLDMVVSKRPKNTIKTVDDTLYMVRSIGTQYDENHGVVPYVNVASNTYAGVSLCGEEGVFDGIKQGDLIKMRMNRLGLIDNCTVIYSMENGVEKVLPTVNERHSASSVVKGIVSEVDVDGERILVDTTEEMAFMVSKTTPVLIYDAVIDTVTVGNINDIEKDDFVNVSLSRSLVNLLAVYKGIK